MLRVTRDHKRLPETMQQFARSKIMILVKRHRVVRGPRTKGDEKSRSGVFTYRYGIEHDRASHCYD